MKKMNKKGFTLIELLAVIIILGVLLLIAVPSVESICGSQSNLHFVSFVDAAAFDGFAGVGRAFFDVDRAGGNNYIVSCKVDLCATYKGNVIDTVDNGGVGIGIVIISDITFVTVKDKGSGKVCTKCSGETLSEVLCNLQSVIS